MSADNLVIVESPAKARTISRMLDGSFNIVASMGHVRDLPPHSLGINIENDFAPQYVENKRSSKIIKEIRGMAKKARNIYLAPDPDREGEAIAWHLKALLENSTNAGFHRVTFHEITKTAINNAFEHMTSLNMNLVNSQQARRILDRIVGYKISPLLWSKIVKGISAGRVQSVALRIICEREREILAFKPEEYWTFTADFEAGNPGSGNIFESKLFKIDSKKIEVSSAEEAGKILNTIKNGTALGVSMAESNPRRRFAAPPFITSTMQQAASSNLNSSAANTMRIAQQLYEGIETGGGDASGLITYMRTDSVNIANEARQACRKFISSECGSEFVPPKPNFYKSKSGAQEAHEAIRPTNVFLTPKKAKPFLSPEQFRLYDLIWRRFVASQMVPAQYRQTTVENQIRGADGRCYTFRKTASVLVFPGFLKVYGNEIKDDADSGIPAFFASLAKGVQCLLKDIRNEQKFTEPPPRYSEASLIKELEANGIGRPSTYASIINTILKRTYVFKEKGRLQPSELGFKVNDYLVQSLPGLFEINFTAEMENKLDKIEEGSIAWTDMLKDFYRDFDKWFNKAKHADTPEQAKPEALISLLDQIEQWAPPEKRGRKIYDDKKFFCSIRDKYREGNPVTANQWQALLTMAAKYSDRLPTLASIATENDFATELDRAREKFEKTVERREQTAASEDDMNKYKKIFSFFDAVEWQKAPKGSRFDDAKFFKSLKSQAENGKILSDKQMNVIKRFAIKYKDGMENPEELFSVLDIKEEAGASGDGPVEKNEEVEKILAGMAEIKNWAEPVKKGRRVYDDKAFFDSIKKQYLSGRKLSPRQISALKKLNGKYSKK